MSVGYIRDNYKVYLCAHYNGVHSFCIDNARNLTPYGLCVQEYCLIGNMGSSLFENPIDI